MPCRPAFICIVLAFGISAHALKAATIVFDDLNRGPVSVLQIGDATISAGTFDFGVTSAPATLANVGLGSGTLESAGTVDRVQDANGFTRESLALSVPGSINSVTLVPFFNVVGSTESVFVPFDVSLEAPQVGIAFLHITDASPFVLNLANDFPANDLSMVSLGLEQDFGDELAAFLHDHPGTTIDFGFAIKSLDYTALVPEPGTSLLFGVGMFTSVLVNRGRVLKSR